MALVGCLFRCFLFYGKVAVQFFQIRSMLGSLLVVGLAHLLLESLPLRNFRLSLFVQSSNLPMRLAGCVEGLLQLLCQVQR